MPDTSPRAGFKTRESMVDGHRALVTVNQTLKELVGKAWCPWHLTITVLLEDELPGSDEEEALSQLEDELHSLLGSVCEDFDYVGRVTLNGIRQLHFYLDAPEDAHEALTATIERGTPRELDHLLAYDPDWAEVDQLFDDA